MVNDAVLLQQVYPGRGMECLLDMTQDRHAEYCRLHGFDYQQTRRFVVKPENFGHWAKVELIRCALEAYHYIVWLDADAYIENMRADLREACRQIGAVRFTCNTFAEHYNTGVLYMESTNETQDFIARWQAKYPGPKEQREQGVFNALAGSFVLELPPTYNYTVGRHFGIDRPIVRGFHSLRTIESKQSAMAARLEMIHA